MKDSDAFRRFMVVNARATPSSSSSLNRAVDILANAHDKTMADPVKKRLWLEHEFLALGIPLEKLPKDIEQY